MLIEPVDTTGMEKVKINLAQLMKLKSRYEGLVSKTKSIVTQHNSVSEGTDHPDVRKAFDCHLVAVNRLVHIKHTLDEANKGQQRERIYLLSELKGLKSWLDGLDTSNGTSGSGPYQSKVLAEINWEEKAKRSSELEEAIFTRQDELDAYNASTRVELPVEFLTPPTF